MADCNIEIMVTVALTQMYIATSTVDESPVLGPMSYLFIAIQYIRGEAASIQRVTLTSMPGEQHRAG